MKTFIRILLMGIIGQMTSAQAQVSFDWADVGDAGNANAATGYGGVAYNYRIAKEEVTIGQYVDFLNAKAASDPLNLYNTSMGTNLNIAGISRSGSSGSYVYSAVGSANRPIVYTNFYDVARFVNWLHNGQGSGDTETGAYHLSTGSVGTISRSGTSVTVTAANTLSVGDQVTTNGTSTYNGSGIVTAATSSSFTFTVNSSGSGSSSGGGFQGVSATHLTGALYWIPTENEWYKAAYYDPGVSGPVSDYWTYPTRSDSSPNNTIGSGANNANIVIYDNGLGGFRYATTGSTYSSSANYLTDGGAFTGSASYYGTFDQAGNAYEWNEAFYTDYTRGMRGGDWNDPSSYTSATSRSGMDPAFEGSTVGFRIASVPEPSMLGLLGVGVIGGTVLLYFRSRKQQIVNHRLNAVVA